MNVPCITLLSFQNKITKLTHVEHNKSIDQSFSRWSYFTIVAEKDHMIQKTKQLGHLDHHKHPLLVGTLKCSKVLIYGPSAAMGWLNIHK